MGRGQSLATSVPLPDENHAKSGKMLDPDTATTLVIENTRLKACTYSARTERFVCFLEVVRTKSAHFIHHEKIKCRTRHFSAVTTAT